MIPVYEKICNELRELRKKYLDLPDKSTKLANDLRDKIYELDKKIKDIDKSVGQGSTPGGNYNPAWKKETFFSLFKRLIK